jgi:MFS family permease
LSSRHRFALLIAVAMAVFQQFSGINAVFYYSTSFFVKANVSNPWLGTVAACVVNVLGTGIAIPLMDRLGRRVLLLASAAGMLVACIVLVVVMNAEAANDASGVASSGFDQLVAVGSILAFVAFFEIGIGPIAWLITAEIFPASVRASAMTVASSVNWSCNFVVGLSFPWINAQLGAWAFAPFAVALLGALLFIARFVPETKNKSIAEIQLELQGGGGSIPSLQQQQSKQRQQQQQQQYNSFD